MLPPVAYISLGSNLGDSRQILEDAILRLRGFSAEPLARSSLWQTEPVDCPPGSPPFINAVVGLQVMAGESPETLLAKLRAMEIEFGRQPKQVLNEARSLDLDLITFGLEMRQGAELTLPHPRAHLRKFVLQPLAEIAPELILPGQAQSVGDLLRNLPGDQKIVML